MKYYIAILVMTLLAGCGDAARPIIPSSRSAAFRTSAQPAPASCTPGIEGYAVRIQGFPEYADTTIYYASGPAEDSHVEVGGPIDHPLFHSTKQLVQLEAARDSCRILGIIDQVAERGDPILADPITIFPDGTHYSKYQLSSSHSEAVLTRWQSDCTWAPGFLTTDANDARWMGQVIPLYSGYNTEFRKGGWRLVVNELGRQGDSEFVNGFHLYGPSGREMIVSHLQAFPICP